MVDMPELPFDNVHKFLAAVGIILIVPALFVEPVYRESDEILLIGILGVVFGLGGWTFEWVTIPYFEYMDDSDSGSGYRAERRAKQLFQLVLAVRVAMPLLFIFSLLIVVL